MCPTPGARAVVIGFTDHIAIVIAIPIGWRNAASIATSAGVEIVGMANNSAVVVTITMGWRDTVHRTVGTIVVRVTCECETGIKPATMITSTATIQCSACLGQHGNSHGSLVVITKMKATISVPSFKLQSKVKQESAIVNKVQWVGHYT